jgi:hypothetical protein
MRNKAISVSVLELPKFDEDGDEEKEMEENGW